MAHLRPIRPLLLSLLVGLFWCTPPALSREEAGAPAARPELLVQLGHAGGVKAAVFSQDGRLIATAGEDSFVRLWDRGTGREIRRFQEFELGVNALAFSPDGRILVTGGGNWDGRERQWSSSGSHTRLITGGDRPFRPGENAIRLWDVRTGREIRRLQGHRTMVTAVAFSPDGARIVSGSADGSIRLWTAATGEMVCKLDKAHRSPVRSVDFSPEGKTFLSADQGGLIRLWDAADAKEIRTWKDAPPLRSARFSPDGRLVVTASGGRTDASFEIVRERACAWSASTGESVRCVDATALALDGLSALAVEPAGLLEWRSGRGEDRARRLDFASGAEQRLPLEGLIGSSFLAFSPEGRQVLLQHSEGARLFDVQGSEPPVALERLAYPVLSVAVSPGGRRIAAGGGDGVIHLWRTDTGKEDEQTLSRIEPDRAGGIGIDAIAFPDGDQLLLSLGQSIARLWNLESGEPVRAEDPGRFSSTFLAADGRTLLQEDSTQGTATLRDGVTGVGKRPVAPLADFRLALSRDARLGITQTDDVFVGRELAHGRELWRIPLQPSLAAFSPDGGTAALATFDGKIVLVDAATGQKKWRAQGHAQPVTALAFSPDGRWLATADGGGSTVLWNAGTGAKLQTLTSHQAGINALAFAPDDRFLITASNDATLRLWNPRTGTEICRLISFKDGAWFVMAPDGRFDTNRLDAIRGLQWVMPDDPLTPLAPEIFLRDYYEPGLLPRLLAGDPFREVRPLADLNRAQPEVRITRVSPRPGVPDEALVEIEVAGTVREIERDGKKVRMESGARDLHLLRDGRLVHVEASISLEPNGRVRRTFPVRLPRRTAPREVVFSAYAFNTDRVKSATDEVKAPLPPELTPVAGRAFLIAIGVAGNESPGWKLSYPANDARRMLKAAGEVLRRSGRYREVVEVPLISGRNADDVLPGEVVPTKDHLRTALERLAGQVRPEDLVLITFSGHGATDASGIFRLYPYDLGGVDEIPPERTISSDELALWLRDIDAGEMALVLDACRSGAAAGPDFKPAPLGDRGLGQLAYDKRMPILAAAQADEDAIGSGVLRHGLLTYALAAEGLEDGKALSQGDFRLETWLAWGRDRVPALYNEKVAPDGDGAERSQEPVLFDFTRR